MQVTKQKLSEMMYFAGFETIDDDLSPESPFGALFRKQLKCLYHDADLEELDGLTERYRLRFALTQIRQATVRADEFRRRLEEAQAKRRESPRGQRNGAYKEIDASLRAIALARPKSHAEVFQLLDSRKVRTPDAKPFLLARGWMRGFQEDPGLARSWLSKRWSILGLPSFRRGPK